MNTDLELLRRYAEEGAQEAFTEVVSRHVNFVYSCARRQVASPDQAKEVTQMAFLELSRAAGRLRPGAPLASWLYVVVRRAARGIHRSERRRIVRESAAYELSTMNSPTTWSQVEPVLDDALEVLDESDRSAIFLRFFENRSLREVGEALGASEAAAGKRVSRALEQLRGVLVKQGVTVSSVALATDMSAHGIEAAPAGTAASVSSGLGFSTGGVAAASAAALGTVAKITLMNSSTKVFATAAAAALAFYFGTFLEGDRTEAATTQPQGPVVLEESRQLRTQLAALTAERTAKREATAVMAKEIARMTAPPPEPTAAEVEQAAMATLRNIHEARVKYAAKMGRPASSVQMLGELGYLKVDVIRFGGFGDAISQMSMDPSQPLAATVGNGIPVRFEPPKDAPTAAEPVSAAREQKALAREVVELPAIDAFESAHFATNTLQPSLQELGKASLALAEAARRMPTYLETHAGVAQYAINPLERIGNDLLKDDGSDPAKGAELRANFGTQMARMESLVGNSGRKSGEIPEAVAVSQQIEALIGVLKRHQPPQSP